MSLKSKSRWQFDPNALTARDVLFIVPAVVGILVLLFTFSLFVSDEVYIRWGGLTVNTAVLFGYFIAHSRLLLQKWAFWILTAILLSIHLAVFGIILTHVDEWKLIWFTPMVLELPVFIFFRNRLSSLS